MRDEPYTPAVARAIAAAPAWALRHGADPVAPLHLLLGLAQEEEGRASALLAGAGLAPARVFAWAGLEPAALRGGEDSPPLGPAAQDALAEARGLARETFGERSIASEHLLLALLRSDAGLRAALEGLGLAFARLEESVLSALGPPLHLEEPLQLVEVAEEIDTARILDAAANRAREALRVLEDHCRFALDDAFLTGELKRLRHDLAAAMSEVPSELLLAARETLRDVGTQISTDQERRRHSPGEVVQANARRLQEALRSLEEHGKLRGAELGQRFEALRYRAYTLERALVRGGDARERLREARLYVLVTGSLCVRPLEWTVREALAGGAQVIQLREKGLGDRALLERARQVRRWTREGGGLFILNDRPDLARLAEADGVHLGQDELPVKDVRRVMGAEALVGVSTHSPAQLRQAVLDGADYIGVGPVFASGTKEFDELAGLEFVRQAAETSLPAFAIGGVTLKNLGAVQAAGARRVAVSGAICGDEDPRGVATALRQLLDASERRGVSPPAG
jgi:thiamine-phosphate pyrophosphorylase